YLLRFYPDSRVKPSMRERLSIKTNIECQAANADTHRDSIVVSDLISAEPSPACTVCAAYGRWWLGPVIKLQEVTYHPGEGDQGPRLRCRRLSLSSVVVDLAFMVVKQRNSPGVLSHTFVTQLSLICRCTSVCNFLIYLSGIKFKYSLIRGSELSRFLQLAYMPPPNILTASRLHNKVRPASLTVLVKPILQLRVCLVGTLVSEDTDSIP
ncbi:hypothetical protein PAXRUDRAFT_128907, partial [Paxillus rubicundulus Ve08.2h10]